MIDTPHSHDKRKGYSISWALLAIIWGTFIGFVGYLLIFVPWWFLTVAQDNTEQATFWNIVILVLFIAISVALSTVMAYLVQRRGPTRRVFIIGYLLWAVLLPLSVTIYGYISLDCLRDPCGFVVIAALFGAIFPAMYLLPFAMLGASLTFMAVNRLIEKVSKRLFKK